MAVYSGLGLRVFHHEGHKRPCGWIPRLEGVFLVADVWGKGEFLFYSGVIVEKLPVLQQITSYLHQARNTEATQREGMKAGGRLGEEGSRGRGRGGKREQG